MATATKKAAKAAPATKKGTTARTCHNGHKVEGGKKGEPCRTILGRDPKRGGLLRCKALLE